MYGYQNPPKPPRNGHTPVVGLPCRISGRPRQKEASLEDQADHGKEVAAEIYPDRPIEYHVVATKAKGERLDREELREIELLIRSKKLDLLIAEDLGRIVRGAVAVWLLGLAVDHGTRVISPNDGIDTDDPDWEADALDACKEHVQYNSHISKRIKHKLMNRFVKHGEVPGRAIFGYIVPEDATTYDDWVKDLAWESIIRQAYQMLLETGNCSAVADWLNSNNVPVGPYCRRSTWSGAMVRRYFKNYLLAGWPGRGFKHTVKHHATGRRVSVRNPKGPRFYECPHLAFFTKAELDVLNGKLAEQNADFGRTDEVEGEFSRGPKKRTRFPGQHAVCWYCGDEFVWGGNGVKENLMCSGCRQRRCWNAIGFNGELAANKVVDAIVQVCQELHGFESQFAQMVEEARASDYDGFTERWGRLRSEESKCRTDFENLAAAIQEYGPKPFLKERLAEIEDRERKLSIERTDLERIQKLRSTIPDHLDDVWKTFQMEFARLAVTSPEFGDLMRRLVPEFHVYLVRLCDGGYLLPRARIRLNLGGCIDGLAAQPRITEWLSRTVTIDLFTTPQRERIRAAVVALAAAEPTLSYEEIAARLPEKVSETVVGHAFALHKKMLELGLDQPYVFVPEPPSSCSKIRRHRHPHYRFQPLPGYEPPPL